MISVGFETRSTSLFKNIAFAAAAVIVGLAGLTFPVAPVAATEPPVSNSEAAPQVAQTPGWTAPTLGSPAPVYGTGAYTPPVYNPFYYTPGVSVPPAYNPALYNAPIAPPPPVTPGYSLFNAPVAPVYNAPWEGGGFYFGPTGSASFMRDSDVIKHFEPRTNDSAWSNPRSITGTSATWSSSSSSWVSSSTPRLGSSDFGRIDSEGSKKKLLTSSTGYDVGARAGYQLGNFRGEFEFDYANNSVDTFGSDRRFRMPTTDFVMRERPVSGSTTGMTFLINGFYDFNLPYLSGFGATPYVGGGIGGGQTSLDLKIGDRTIVNDSGWGLAYQLGAGVRYQVMPGLALDLGYRYKGITDVTLRNDFEKITVPNRSHNFQASLTYSFSTWTPLGSPPIQYTPPPPPPPPPARPGLPVM